MRSAWDGWPSTNRRLTQRWRNHERWDGGVGPNRGPVPLPNSPIRRDHQGMTIRIEHRAGAVWVEDVEGQDVCLMDWIALADGDDVEAALADLSAVWAAEQCPTWLGTQAGTVPAS